MSICGNDKAGRNFLLLCFSVLVEIPARFSLPYNTLPHILGIENNTYFSPFYSSAGFSAQGFQGCHLGVSMLGASLESLRKNLLPDLSGCWQNSVTWGCKTEVALSCDMALSVVKPAHVPVSSLGISLPSLSATSSRKHLAFQRGCVIRWGHTPSFKINCAT